MCKFDSMSSTKQVLYGKGPFWMSGAIAILVAYGYVNPGGRPDAHTATDDARTMREHVLTEHAKDREALEKAMRELGDRLILDINRRWTDHITTGHHGVDARLRVLENRWEDIKDAQRRIEEAVRAQAAKLDAMAASGNGKK